MYEQLVLAKTGGLFHLVIHESLGTILFKESKTIYFIIALE